MLLQVHDELVFEVPTGEVEALTALVREAWKAPPTLSVPLVVDIGVGDNWLTSQGLSPPPVRLSRFARGTWRTPRDDHGFSWKWKTAKLCLTTTCGDFDAVRHRLAPMRTVAGWLAYAHRPL